MDGPGATVGITVLRATVVAGTMAIAATAWIGRDLSDLAAQPVVFGLAYLAMALAVALRFGAIPFHGWAARLTDAVPEADLPLVTGWAPAAFAIVALAWIDASIAPLLVDLDAARVVVLGIAIASIVLALVAAWIQDDLEHIVGYSIVGDAGVVLLALAALSPDAWAPARTWIIVLRGRPQRVCGVGRRHPRTTFYTGRVGDLRGWAVRAPLLAGTFVLVIVASIGLPGLAGFEARAQIVDVTLEDRCRCWSSSPPSPRSPTTYGCCSSASLGRIRSRRRPRLATDPDATGRHVLARLEWPNWSANRAFAASIAALGLAVVAAA